MPGTLLASIDTFDGGHWGDTGARHAKPNSYGGDSVAVTRDGLIVPASASRPIVFSNLADGQIYGTFWAYGIDGRIYFVQAVTVDDAPMARVRRFHPDDPEPVVITDVGDPIPVPTRLPDWTTFSRAIFVTFYAENTWGIDPVGLTMTIVDDGASQEAPGGRAIALVGERLFIAGIDDVDYGGAKGNRVVYSEPADIGNFPVDNFFDLGADNTEIAAIYPMRDQVVFFLSDQSIWTMTGIPGFNANLRRVNAYQKGTGGITTFTHDNGAVDPAQNRIWFFDHTSRGPARWAGAQQQRLPGFGIVTPNRTTEGKVGGKMAMFGGPDEWIFDRVPIARTDGVPPTEVGGVLIRLGDQVSLVKRRVLTGRN